MHDTNAVADDNDVIVTLPLPKRRPFAIFLQLSFMLFFATRLVGIKKGLTHVSVAVIVGNALE